MGVCGWFNCFRFACHICILICNCNYNSNQFSLTHHTLSHTQRTFINGHEEKAFDARSVWPITQTETIFLPCFKIYERPLQKEFRIQRLIDSGAFGKVYQVEDKITSVKFALKILSKANVSKG